MPISAYSTQFMIETVASLRSVNRSSFMLDTFFGQYVPPTGREEIAFDVEDDSLGIVPFVSPLREGKVLPMLGNQTKYFRPAYIKAKKPLNPFAPLKRMVGEKVGGVLSPADREKAIVAREMNDLFGRTVRRLELMGIDSLIDGKLTVTGDGYDAVELNFGRAAGNSKTLVDGSQWDDANVSPVADLDAFIAEITALVGIMPDVVVMDAKAWALYEADPKYEKRRDVTSGGNNAVQHSFSTAAAKGAIKKATLDGGAITIFVYQQVYKHPTSGAITNMIPDYSVFVGSTDPRAQGTRYFGTIVDPELGYDSQLLVDPESGLPIEVAPKTWTTPDPAQRILMLQCAPLVAPTRPNATGYMLVKS